LILVLGYGLLPQPVQLAGAHVPFELLVSLGCVISVKPLAKRGQLLGREVFNVLLDFFKLGHVGFPYLRI